MLKDIHKETQKIVEQYENGIDCFLARIVAGDEIWLNLELEMKRQSIEWHHAFSLKRKKFKTASSEGKVIATVFFDSERILLVDIMLHGHH